MNIRADPACLLAAGQPWFSALGDPLDKERRRAAAGWLRGLSMRADLAIRLVSSWAEAAEVLCTPGDGWWEREEEERRSLERQVALPFDPLEWMRMNDALHAAAAAAAGRCGGADASMVKVAAGAGACAAYHAMLARAAGVPAWHPFLQKHALFAAGRW